MLPLLGVLGPILGKLLGGVASKAVGVVSEYVEDKDLANKINAELSSAIITTDLTKYVAQINAQRDVLVAEISGKSWLQRNWRPMTMMVFVAIIANNYIIYPYLSLFDSTADKTTLLDLPDMMWECIKLGLSGYIVGRSAEKIASGGGIKAFLGNLKNGKG